MARSGRHSARSTKRNGRVAKRDRAIESTARSVDRLSLQSESSQGALLPSVRDIPELNLARGKVYTFAITSIPNLAIAASTTGSGQSLYFTLSSLNNASAYTAIFDQYRIIQGTVSFIPQASVYGTGATNIYGKLLTVIDYDDSIAPTSSADIVNYDSCQVNQVGSFISRTLAPRSAMGVYSGAFTSFAQTPYGTWSDCGSPSVQYYGIKYWLEPSSSGLNGTPLWDIHARYVIQFRRPRG